MTHTLPPPKWKLWLIAVPLLYALVLLYDYTLAPHIRSWPTPITALVLPIILFTALSYVLMPIATKIFARWLMPGLPQHSLTSPKGTDMETDITDAGVDLDSSPRVDTSTPIGLNASGTRSEFDSMGAVDVPADRYWGAQTQRSLVHFSIGNDRMPAEVYHAYGYVKKAAALVNNAAGRLPQWKADAIVAAADEAIAGSLDQHFPLFVWQTGSGTQSNMNVNEVLSNRAIQLVGGILGSQHPIGPNDDVNMGQSSNDTFPTAMHIAAATEIDNRLLPSATALADELERKSALWADVVKIGRTHLEDAVPLTVGQEWSGWAAQLRACIADIEHSRLGLYELAAGGTAVGTGLNAPAGFSEQIAHTIAELTGKPFVTAPNKFAAQGSLDPMVRAHAALRSLAVTLMKIANDMRWLASGPRTGFAELVLPSNEPGSSIMPG